MMLVTVIRELSILSGLMHKSGSAPPTPRIMHK